MAQGFYTAKRLVAEIRTKLPTIIVSQQGSLTRFHHKERRNVADNRVPSRRPAEILGITFKVQKKGDIAMSKRFWGVGLGAFSASCALLAWGALGGPGWSGHAGFGIWLLLSLWAFWGYSSHSKGENWKTKYEAKKKAQQQAREEDRALRLNQRR